MSSTKLNQKSSETQSSSAAGLTPSAANKDKDGNVLRRILSRRSAKSKNDLAEPTLSPTDERDTDSQDIARTIIDEEPSTASPPEQVSTPAASSSSAPVDPATVAPPLIKKRRSSVAEKLGFRRFGGGGEKKEKEKKVAAAVPVAEEEVPIANAAIDETASTNVASPTTTDLAKRVRELLTAVPPFYPTTTTLSTSPNGAKSTPSSSSPQEDLNSTGLLSLLSNADIMSGKNSGQSVWSILDRMSFSFEANMNAAAQSKKGAKSPEHPDSSIMLCAPLIPTDGDQVELGEYKLLQVPLDELDEDGTIKTAGWWPPFGWGKKDKDKDKVEPAKPSKEVRVWIPSKEKISLQCAWWGFRVWMPPPVLRILDDKTVEAAKRAAMLTTALQWLLSNVPVASLPLELQAVMSVVKAIVPILGYLGGFIAWSWSTIKSFDKGEGVVLSATWLLPIALIPGAWDFKLPEPEPEPEPEPAPAPAPAPNPTPAPAPVEPTPPPPPAPTEPAPTPAPEVPTNPPAPTPIPEPSSPIATNPPPPLPVADGKDPHIIIPNKDGDFTKID